ncbi:MAG: hypothetical protein JWM53_375 [bacterium]|nr:hypothetical protein [bacterium]
MKVWALLPLLASSGCLFLDDLNRPPTISLQDTITTTFKGGVLTVVPVAGDPDDPPRSLKISFRVKDGDQLLGTECDYEISQLASGYGFRFFRPGIFEVIAVVEDPQGSTASTSEMVTISDAPPAFDAQATVVPTSTRDACNLIVAGDIVTFGLMAPNGIAPVSDADADAASPYPKCPGAEKLTYTWRIREQPSGTNPVLTLLDTSGCRKPTATSGLRVSTSDPKAQVCLWTDPMIVGDLAMYSLAVDVSDGTSSATLDAGAVAVTVDEPPCITGTDPIAGSYVVDRTQLQQFDVDGVVDDRDLFGAGIGYAWSVWRQSDQTWRPVPSWTLSTYQLDVSSFGVGEKVRVRVEALDRTGARASTCSLDSADCTVPSCASSPDVCHKWKTWDLELR